MTERFDFLKEVLSKTEPFTFVYQAGNAGDALIAYSLYRMFDEMGLRYDMGKDDQKYQDKTLILGGGGNLIGGLYDEGINFINNNIDHNEIIILPHTIYNVDDLSKWLKTGKLTVFCREETSFKYVKGLEGATDKVFLSEDMAFSLPKSHFESFNATNPTGMCYAFRKDKEAKNREIPEDNIDISQSWVGKLWYNKKLCKTVSESLAAYLGSYQQIVTDRLHVAILSGMMGKKVTMFANSYYKNRAMYEYSIAKRWPHVNFNN